MSEVTIYFTIPDMEIMRLTKMYKAEGHTVNTVRLTPANNAEVFAKIPEPTEENKRRPRAPFVFIDNVFEGSGRELVIAKRIAMREARLAAQQSTTAADNDGVETTSDNVDPENPTT